MKKSPIIITPKSNFNGVVLVQMFRFRNGLEVPMYEVSTISGFNQLIGYSKFVNRDYGEVYYRGVNKVFDNVLPSLMRARTSGDARDLKQVINKLYYNNKFRETLKLSLPVLNNRLSPGENSILKNNINRNNKYIIEGVLQHYSGTTRFLDIVDNHWVALWMGLYKYEELGKGHLYSRYTKRMIPQIDYLEHLAKCFSKDKIIGFSSLEDIANVLKVDEDELDKYYLYVLLIATPNDMVEQLPGSFENQDFALVDLRKALPSFFLRPHAQHAYVIKVRDKEKADEYDLASQVVGIIKIRVDKADEWLGNGTLLTQSNLFPPPAIDQGYYTLLEYYTELTGNFRIKNYLSEVK